MPYPTSAIGQLDRSCIQIGALAPLSQPGWVDAGRHLLAGLELGIEEVNSSGGIFGRSLELLVRDTAADAHKAAAAVDELSRLGVVALAGEYHSVAARGAATQADVNHLPYLCSSAVLDKLTEQSTDWVARLAPAQSHSWSIYANYLLDAGHRNVAIAIDPASVYWASGSRILRENLSLRGATVNEFDVRAIAPAAMCDELARGTDRATALILLFGKPELVVSIVRAVSRDKRLAGVLMGAPAGQPEFAEWVRLLGSEGGVSVSFLRYLPDQLSPLGARVEAILRDRLAETPSFVAFEGYDTIIVLADVLRSRGTDRMIIAPDWSRVDAEGTRGRINFSRITGINVWQWTWSPIQVADRDPVQPNLFRTLHVV